MADIKRVGMVFDDALSYLTVIALPGFKEFVDYHENPDNPGLHIRRFVVACESLNNALDYFYWQEEPEGNRRRLDEFRRQITKSVGELAALADIANAYKHAVRRPATGIPQATRLIKHASLTEVMRLHDTPDEMRRRINQWIDPAWVAELMTAGAWWQAFADAPTGVLYQQLVGALPA